MCGATNIAPGQRIPVALPGAVLPGNRRIERAEKMGVVSNGMLCSGAELNLTADGDGILILPADTPLGVPLADLYGDVVLDVDVKPNRGDALSILGPRARGRGRDRRRRSAGPSPWWRRGAAPRPPSGSPSTCRSPDLCTRFVGRWVSGVTVGPSPDRVQMRLLAAGQRPISNVVDASNYVMLELGKPIHTFDAAAVHAGADGRPTIVVRRAAAGERLETLDHVTRDPDRRHAAHRRPAGLDRHRRASWAAPTARSPTRPRDVVVESGDVRPGEHPAHGPAARAPLRGELAGSRRARRRGWRGSARTARPSCSPSGRAATIAPGRVDTAPDEPGAVARRVPARRASTASWARS